MNTIWWKQGLPWLPLSNEGLNTISHWLQQPELKPIQISVTNDNCYPAMLQINESDWQNDQRPSRYESKAFRRILFDYLGPRGLKLLTACAAYPQLHSDLTLALEKNSFPMTPLSGWNSA